MSEVVEKTESDKNWQEYLQKCCEVGQLINSLDRLDSQKRQIEKNIEVTQRAVKSLFNKHLQFQGQSPVPTPEPSPETEGVAH